MISESVVYSNLIKILSEASIRREGRTICDNATDQFCDSIGACALCPFHYTEDGELDNLVRLRRYVESDKEPSVKWYILDEDRKEFDECVYYDSDGDGLCSVKDSSGKFKIIREELLYNETQMLTYKENLKTKMNLFEDLKTAMNSAKSEKDVIELLVGKGWKRDE